MTCQFGNWLFDIVHLGLLSYKIKNNSVFVIIKTLMFISLATKVGKPNQGVCKMRFDYSSLMSTIVNQCKICNHTVSNHTTFKIRSVIKMQFNFSKVVQCQSSNHLFAKYKNLKN